MDGEDRDEHSLVVPMAKAVVLTSAILPPLAVAAIGIPLAAFLLHRSRDKNLKAQYLAAKAKLAKLEAERDAAMAERDSAVAEKQTALLELEGVKNYALEIYGKAAVEARSLMKQYEETLMDAEAVNARLIRSDSCNQELQQTLRKERAERAQRERRIAELEAKIQEQRAIIRTLRKTSSGSLTARSDDSASAAVENKPVELETPPVTEGERKSKASWPSKLPRPPVPFRDMNFRPVAPDSKGV